MQRQSAALEIIRREREVSTRPGWVKAAPPLASRLSSSTWSSGSSARWMGPRVASAKAAEWEGHRAPERVGARGSPRPTCRGAGDARVRCSHPSSPPSALPRCAREKRPAKPRSNAVSDSLHFAMSSQLHPPFGSWSDPTFLATDAKLSRSSGTTQCRKNGVLLT